MFSRIDFNDVTSTVDSLGGAQIEGSLAKGNSKHNQGVEIIQRLGMEMLDKTEDNSYHINIFTTASEEMIRRAQEDTDSEIVRIADQLAKFRQLRDG